MAILTNVLESSLGDYNRDYIEKRLKNYTDEAKKQIRDLLLSCVYEIAYISPDGYEIDYINLVEYDFDGNYVSSTDIFSDSTEF